MEKVIAYFRKEEGVFQKFEMSRIDYDEAVKPRTITTIDGTMKAIEGSKEWSLDVPPGAIVESKIPLPIVIERQEPVSVPVMPTASPQPLKRKVLGTARAS